MAVTPHKLSAYDRIHALLDENSVEIIYNESVVAAKGKVNGRCVYAYAQDYSCNAGAMTEEMAVKICEVMDLALRDLVPLISINECAGAHIQEGVRSLAGFGEIFKRNILASGVIPQISVILGPCAGGAVYSPALTDFTLMLKDSSYMFITGPGVVRAVTGENVTKEDLGGASVHAHKSGVAHFMADNEQGTFQTIRDLLGFLPINNREEAPVVATTDSADRVCENLNDIVPDNPRKPYDMHEVIAAIVDNGKFLEVHKSWAKNIIVGFTHMNGKTVGVVANQPKILAGVLDSDSSRKAARFVRFCDSFNIPLLTLVDVPGFLCGTHQEHGGVITHGATLVYAYGEATVPKVTVTLRKSYGGAHVTMGCKQLQSDVNFAWPSASIAVMGAEGAVEVLHSKKLKDIEDPHYRGQLVEDMIIEYNDTVCSPSIALDSSNIDEIIEPSQTRAKVIVALENCKAVKQAVPWKKHGCMPL